MSIQIENIRINYVLLIGLHRGPNMEEVKPH